MNKADANHESLAWNMVDQQLRRRGIRDRAVLEAMGRVPRHLFLPGTDPKDAYSDRALPTTHGQTISQPYMVAMMTELLAVSPGHRVLEVGTGSGYQAAILAQLGAQIISVERDPELAQRVRHTLEELGWASQVDVVEADGTLGWPAGAPYDRILVTAGAPNLPESYKQQLAEGGRIVIPIGDRLGQHIFLYERCEDSWSQTQGIACRFVPLIGEQGWPPDDHPPQTR